MINQQSAHKFCKDATSKIENYDKAMSDTTKTWQCHHRLELTLDGEFAHSRAELMRLEMYFNRPYFELIFLTQREHNKLHNKGKNNPLYGKTMSTETKMKMSAAHKARWARYRAEKLNE